MILFRYLSREVLTSMLAVSITLLVIVISGRMAAYLTEAASGEIAPAVVFSIIMFRIPSFLELVLPLGLFIGILLAYGRLYVDSEMAVMSACGLSINRLVVYTLIPSIFVALLVAYISLYAGPAGKAKIQQIFQDVKASSGLETLIEGRFRTDDKTGRVTYIHSFSKDKKFMREVFTSEQKINQDGRLEQSVLLAEQGYIEQYEQYGGRYLVMENGRRYVGLAGEANYERVDFFQFAQRIKDPIVKDVYLEAYAQNFDLLLKSNELRDIAAVQWRVSLSLLVPIIALIALALSKTNHRKGRYVKMLPALLIYITYMVLLSAAKDALEHGKIPPAIGIWWVHAIFLVLALLLLYGDIWWRRLAHHYKKAVPA